MDYLIMAAQLMLSLSILVVLHELGHFLPARWFKTKVEKFYLFFDPWFSIVKKKIGETEYGIGWLPLGGYVKIAGMIDESMDTEQMKQPAQPWEFRSKPAWQRLIIMLGGVTVNFILGFLLYAMVLFVWGEQYLPAESAKHGIAVDSLGYEMGLRDGDKILNVGGVPFTRFNDRLIMREIVINNAKYIELEREGNVMQLPVGEFTIKMLTSAANKGKTLFEPRFPFVIEAFAKDAPAEKSGLMKGDRVIAFNGTPTPYFHEFAKLARQNKSKEVLVTVIRNEADTLTRNPILTEHGKMGAAPRNQFEMKRDHYSITEALPAGVRKGWQMLTDQIKAFGQMFKGNIKFTESVGGFGSIASMFGTEWLWERFWLMTAMLSLILAFMNLLPIPALDGGHVMFLLYEVITGRKPSDKFMEYATLFGFILVLGLVVFVNGRELWGAISHWFIK